MFETEIPPKQEVKGSAGWWLYGTVSNFVLALIQLASYGWKHDPDRILFGALWFVNGLIALHRWRVVASQPLKFTTIASEEIDS